MTATDTKEWINRLIREDRLYSFYKSKEWKKLKEQIIRENHGECAHCREIGKVTKAVTVHHIQYVKKHPELALSRTYVYKGKEYDNLIPLCHDCHDRVHERMQYKHKKEPLTPERW